MNGDEEQDDIIKSFNVEEITDNIIYLNSNKLPIELNNKFIGANCKQFIGCHSDKESIEEGSFPTFMLVNSIFFFTCFLFVANYFYISLSE